jgi:peptidoglycan/LPS O-acetylase OafA/YrhL
METSSSAHHLDALTGVRAFAALWIFVFHGWSNGGSPTIRVSIAAQSIDLTPLAAFGWLGLDVFFVLSGFLLTRQAFLKLQRAAPAASTSVFVAEFGEKYSSYLRRRILRVYPAYYACITVLLILAATGVYLRLPGKLELLLHLGMVHNFVEKYIATMNGVFWTMPFEWQFYIVFPLLFILLRRHGAWSLYGIVVLGVLASKFFVMATNNGYAQVLLPIRLDEFAAGMCAGAYAVGRPLTRTFATTAFWAGLGVLLATPWVFAGYSQVGHYYDLKGFLRPPWIQLGICLMLLGLTGDRHAGVHIFGNKIVVGLGLISYSIYLWHVPILELLPTFGLIPQRTTNVDVSWPRIVAMALPLVLLLSTLSYWVIERPFQASGKPAKAVEKRRLSFGKFALAYPLLALLIWAIVLEAYLFLRSR